MNTLSIYAIKTLRKLYEKYYKSMPLPMPECEQKPILASKLIYDKLLDDKPCMIARFGSTELTCLMNYLGVHKDKRQIRNYIIGKTNPWWWDRNIMNQMQQWSGFFPSTVDKIERFCELMLNDLKEVDVLGSWLQNETNFEVELKNALKVNFLYLEPFWAELPWTRALEGKKVLVVHPFAKTIASQFKNKDLLFSNNLLPNFELSTIKAVQSIAGEKTDFNDWFEALESMKSEIDKRDYDICLIGAGAYGFPLAAHVKRMGKKAIHLGGSLQLLFGIMGSRWQQGNYLNEVRVTCPDFFNKHWVFPSKDEIPINSQLVENSCYWKSE